MRAGGVRGCCGRKGPLQGHGCEGPWRLCGVSYGRGDPTALRRSRSSTGASRCRPDFGSSQLRSASPSSVGMREGRTPALIPAPRPGAGGSQGDGGAALRSQDTAGGDSGSVAHSRLTEIAAPIPVSLTTLSVSALPPSPPAVKAVKEKALG